MNETVFSTVPKSVALLMSTAAYLSKYLCQMDCELHFFTIFLFFVFCLESLGRLFEAFYWTSQKKSIFSLKNVLRNIMFKIIWSWLHWRCLNCAAALWQSDLVLWSTQRWRRLIISGQTRLLMSWCKDIVSIVATADRILPQRGLHCVWVWNLAMKS